jgi:polar amino acid transport system substrate-binding protein
MNYQSQRRNFFKIGSLGLAGALGASAMSVLGPRRAAAQVNAKSLLRTVLDRGHVLVGTGSTNAPWHFEDEAGKLVGMDIAMARILAKGLFDDESKVKFVLQDPGQRIPNIAAGKVDIVIQFMTMTPQRAQLIAFTQPYFAESMALLGNADGNKNSFQTLLAGGAETKVSVLQNVDAESLVHKVLPKAQVLPLDTLVNVIQALDSRRVDAAAVNLSAVRWMVKRTPNRYADAGKSWYTMLYGAAVRQGDPDWLEFVNTAFNVAMRGHQNEIYDKALNEYFGIEAPVRPPGFPSL